jgi:hypothetical protein
MSEHVLGIESVSMEVREKFDALTVDSVFVTISKHFLGKLLASSCGVKPKDRDLSEEEKEALKGFMGMQNPMQFLVYCIHRQTQAEVDKCSKNSVEKHLQQGGDAEFVVYGTDRKIVEPEKVVVEDDSLGRKTEIVIPPRITYPTNPIKEGIKCVKDGKSQDVAITAGSGILVGEDINKKENAIDDATHKLATACITFVTVDKNGIRPTTITLGPFMTHVTSTRGVSTSTGSLLEIVANAYIGDIDQPLTSEAAEKRYKQPFESQTAETIYYKVVRYCQKRNVEWVLQKLKEFLGFVTIGKNGVVDYPKLCLRYGLPSKIDCNHHSFSINDMRMGVAANNVEMMRNMNVILTNSRDFRGEDRKRLSALNRLYRVTIPFASEDLKVFVYYAYIAVRIGKVTKLPIVLYKPTSNILNAFLVNLENKIVVVDSTKFKQALYYRPFEQIQSVISDPPYEVEPHVSVFCDTILKKTRFTVMKLDDMEKNVKSMISDREAFFRKTHENLMNKGVFCCVPLSNILDAPQVPKQKLYNMFFPHRLETYYLTGALKYMIEEISVSQYVENFLQSNMLRNYAVFGVSPSQQHKMRPLEFKIRIKYPSKASAQAIFEDLQEQTYSNDFAEDVEIQQLSSVEITPVDPDKPPEGFASDEPPLPEPIMIVQSEEAPPPADI